MKINIRRTGRKEVRGELPGENARAKRRREPVRFPMERSVYTGFWHRCLPGARDREKTTRRNKVEARLRPAILVRFLSCFTARIIHVGHCARVDFASDSR